MAMTVAMVYQSDQIRVFEHVTQLVGHVSMVDGDGDGAGLGSGQHRLDEVRAVERVEADVVSRADAPIR